MSANPLLLISAGYRQCCSGALYTAAAHKLLKLLQLALLSYSEIWKVQQKGAGCSVHAMRRGNAVNVAASLSARMQHPSVSSPCPLAISESQCSSATGSNTNMTIQYVRHPRPHPHDISTASASLGCCPCSQARAEGWRNSLNSPWRGSSRVGAAGLPCTWAIPLARVACGTGTNTVSSDGAVVRGAAAQECHQDCA